MKSRRNRIQELEQKLELLQTMTEYYKEDRDFYKAEAQRLQIAESLLTHEQFGEYCSLIVKRDKEKASV